MHFKRFFNIKPENTNLFIIFKNNKVFYDLNDKTFLLNSSFLHFERNLSCLALYSSIVNGSSPITLICFRVGFLLFICVIHYFPLDHFGIEVFSESFLNL